MDPPSASHPQPGAASNLSDRLRHGGVVDFIALAFWPAFNFADAAIVAGLASA
ncbi:MAG: signal peptidase II [Solirubrobacteraceae bacterium]